MPARRESVNRQWVRPAETAVDSAAIGMLGRPLCHKKPIDAGGISDDFALSRSAPYPFG